MRFSSTFFRPRSYAELPVGDITGPDRGEAGSDGDPWLNEILGGGPDINPELTGSRKFKVYDEMRKTDPSVKSMLSLIKLTIRGAVWGLNPRSDEPQAHAIRDAAAANFGLDEDEYGWMDVPFKGLLERCQQLLDMGVFVGEKVWGDVREWRDADGDSHLIRPLVRVAPRPPHSIQKVEFGLGGELKRVTQSFAGTRPIPGDKLVYLVLEREDGRWDGVSLLRPAWGPWTFKRAVMISAGLGWDRFAMGLPVVWYPDTPEGEDEAKTVGRSLRAHQRSYVRFPVPQGGTKDDSEWALDLLNGAQTLADPTALLRFFSEQIAEAGMQQFSRQGLGQTGARATAEVQIDPFYLACSEFADDIRLELGRQLIRHFIDVNFGREAAEMWTPVLTVSRIQARNVQVISSAIAQLAGAGFMLTDREAQDDIRDMLGLSKLPNDLDSMGIDRERLRQILAAQGMDETILAGIVNALPEDFGVARNRVGVPREGDGLRFRLRRG